MVSPQPQVTLLREGPVRLGDRVYEAIETPGHAAGHLVFYDAEAEVIFCGDHVLPQISPNVSFLPQVEENPLGAYLSSLQEIGRLPVKMAYPGHREPWQGFGARAEELVRHHHERLALMEGQLSAPLSAYEVCRATFGDRLSIHQMRFALSETIAHLILLEAEGRIQQVDPASRSHALCRDIQSSCKKASNRINGWRLYYFLQNLHPLDLGINARISYSSGTRQHLLLTYFNGLL